MKTSINYITNLPDFITMQRTSFCWFMTKGLSEEVGLFSKIYDFSHNIKYILFGEEYHLTNTLNTLNVARKYNGNFRINVVIPIEVRNKKLKTILHQNQFPIISLPLMTNSGTFFLNGCERVIVSQIIRSPGIYFEKNKNQKNSYYFKRKLPTEIGKLGEFLPSGEAYILESELFFPIPKLLSDDLGNKKVIPFWKNSTLSLYSIKFFKLKYQLLQSYVNIVSKFYQIIIQEINYSQKIKLIHFLNRWFKLRLFKQENLLESQMSSKLSKRIDDSIELLKKDKKFSLPFFKKMSEFFLIKMQFNNPFIFLTLNNRILLNPIPFLVEKKLTGLESICWLKNNNEINYKKINNKTPSLKINFKELRPIIYYSKSFKNQLKYIYKRRRNSHKITKFRPQRHKYLKSKTRLLIFQKDHTIQTSYHKRYGKKDLYTATLIPEYGSWIRFGFQKNTKINQYRYPLKHQEENVTIQLDKINQKPVLYLLKEMGLTNLEIYRNLEHSDFFYFTKPLLVNSSKLNQPILRFHLNSQYFKDISTFSRIFDPTYYRLGKVGRLQINKRLNIDIAQNLQTITYEDIFAIIDKLLTLTIYKTIPDDIDHLKNRRVRPIGELLQNLFRIGFQRLVRKLRNQTNKLNYNYILSFDIINATIKEFFSSSQLSQYLDQTNPLSSLTHRRRISCLGPGGFDRDRISFAVRDIHPSHYGRICPIETPEGQNVGLIASLTTYARINKLGFLETPFWRVINGKVLKTETPIYLTADLEDRYKIAPADISTNKENYLIENEISVRYKQDFINISPAEVDFISISPVQIVSVAASLIPFFEHDDANRALMGSNMQRQSVPLLLPQKPIVGTGLEHQIAADSGMIINAKISGTVDIVTANQIAIRTKKGQKVYHRLDKYLRSNQQTCINHRPIIWKGEKIKSGQILTDGPSISGNEMALGQNIIVGYMPWQGYNFEDAILISERLVYNDIFTSIHIERYKIEIDRGSELSEETTRNIPNLHLSEIKNLNEDGIIRVGTFVKPGDILVGKVIINDTSEQVPEAKLLQAIFGAKAKGVKDNSYRMGKADYGRVIETISFNQKTKFTYKLEKIYIFIAQMRKIQVGDKIAGRHGNKGIISRILSRQDMPFLPDGTPIDIILNPLGVPSRMNVGQLYECLLGLAGDKLNCRFKILPFDEMYGVEMSRILINKKLRQASIAENKSWLFNPYAPGKMVLMDGRTGTEFENPITVGNAYMLKLIHLVDDKMHARATGPYSLITQQPLRGKAQQGGQRFGEMEVWALEGFGAAFTLKELLTIKSDDMQGRNETLNAIVKGQTLPKFGIPESFKVLLQELRSIGLDMSTYKIEKFSSHKTYEVEVNLIEKYNSVSKTFSPTSNINDITF